MSTADPQDDRLQQRIVGRNRAAEVLDIAECECKGMSAVARESYWQSIRDAAMECAPLPEPAPNIVKATPMTDEQCREFEKEQIPFGMYQGLRVGCADPDYLRHAAGYTFIDDLRRYLANVTIAREGTS